ncbi:LysR family transcriptional regulator [Wukongibacter sp. M2B1]|uniref:LysR family transcriptional regulator n=1 Tax=Wukongibacter sp. M2B1 TaxID=3088895 RepID=UPI003D7A043C
MNSLQIEYFMELCKTLSFTKTAKNFYVSQPAVSKQISSLEKEIGIILFDRTNKNVSLTPAGKLFYDFFFQTIKAYKQTFKEANKLIDMEKKTIVVGLLEGWDLSRLLPHIYNSVNLKLSNITLNFASYSFKDLIHKIEAEDIDLALSISGSFNNSSSIDIKKLTSISSLLFYSRNHPLSAKQNLKFEDFKDDTFIVFSGQSINTKSRITEICQPHNFTPKISTVPNIESMVLHVESGLGVAIFDEWIRYKYNPMLKYINTGSKHEVNAVWKKDNSNYVINLFIDELIFLLSNF